MIAGSNYQIDFFIDGSTNFSIQPQDFVEFNIIENLNYNIYYGELKLKGAYLWDMVFAGGEKISCDVIMYNPSITYTFKFIVYSYILRQNFIEITLVPEIFDKLTRERITKGYNEQIGKIVSDICDDVGITEYDIDTIPTAARLFLQLNETYFYTLKYITKYAGKRLLFIDKFDKLYLKSIDNLSSNSLAFTYNNMDMVNVKCENELYSLQLTGGFGSKGYYFDWDNGDVKNYSYTPIASVDKVDSNLITENNSISMQGPIGTFLYDEKYNKNIVENTVFRKNFSKMFISFDIFVNELDVNLMDKVQLDMVSGGPNINNQMFSGEYFVYQITHSFNEVMYYQHLTCCSKFLFQDPASFR